ncbi:baculoviral IAP repeat-containing protein 7-B-like isoform X2 [Dreissena polymorpha]|uniref:baculoviral IAP repeat-containing protein 7-B-like isoform X2 n=1 Tax=Dreissena polymorpha TaxID=45954 RepID=UPI002264AE41|nr:baculoviral IAP repeat-containing protein 7-B-like isoform X2 [Dreissena polymorpha]
MVPQQLHTSCISVYFGQGPGDLVRCFCCGIGLKDFNEADDPMEEHIKYASKCAYLETLFGAEELKRRLEVIKSMEPENIRQMQYMEFKTNQGNDFSTKPYRHPEMSSSEKRLDTFRNPNFHSVISPQRMAGAGLYFTGEDDLVRCFACDGGFRNWEVYDDPWTEHCRWFPSCRFSREVKGDAFIETVQRQTTGARPSYTNTETETRHQNDLMMDSEIEMLRVTIVDDMGFSDDTFKTAIREVKKKNGTIPSIDDVIALIEIMNIQGPGSNGDTFNQECVHDDPLTENQLLKNLLLCMRCKSKDANVLFLPCAHHRMCTDCALGIETCPVCLQKIQSIVQTFLS